ncbi:MAG: hypothetical protein RM021_021700 [Nostoc sp. EkiNYC01]|nr:hypothetical protein [Nostoc sp. EkiNYC01]
MLNANHLFEAACYVDEKKRKWVVLCILKTCYKTLSAASFITRIEELKSSFESGFMEFNNFIYGDFLEESFLMNAVKVCMCFENFFKAELLLSDYIIHEIDETVNQGKYIELAQRQQKYPIKISEIKQEEGLLLQQGNEYSFQSLKKTTIKFNHFLNKKKYYSEIAVPKKLIQILYTLNKRRNTLHYFVTDSYEVSNENIDEFIYIKEYFNKYLVSKTNILVQELGFPDVHLVKPL